MISTSRFKILTDWTHLLVPRYRADTFFCTGSNKRTNSGTFYVYYTHEREKEIAVTRLVRITKKRNIDETDGIKKNLFII